MDGSHRSESTCVSALSPRAHGAIVSSLPSISGTKGGDQALELLMWGGAHGAHRALHHQPPLHLLQRRRRLDERVAPCWAVATPPHLDKSTARWATYLPRAGSRPAYSARRELRPRLRQPLLLSALKSPTAGACAATMRPRPSRSRLRRPSSTAGSISRFLERRASRTRRCRPTRAANSRFELAAMRGELVATRAPRRGRVRRCNSAHSLHDLAL